MTLQDYRLRKFKTIKAFAEAYGCGATKASGILNGHYHLTLSRSEVGHLAFVLGIDFVACADACDETYAQLNHYKGDAWKRTAKTYKGIWARWAWEEGLLKDTRRASVTNDWAAYREKYITRNSSSANEKPKQSPPRMPETCFSILGIASTATVAQIKSAFVAKVKAASDGRGGFTGDMDKLTLAKEQALAYVGRRK